MTERYVRPTVPGWLAPTLLGPFLTVYGVVTAFAALGIDRGPFGKVLGWALGMALGTVWATVFVLVLALFDVALLAVKVRTLPTGKRGWGTALLSPLAVLAVYTVVPPYAFYRSGPWAVVAAALVPMVVVGLGARVAFGQKPLR